MAAWAHRLGATPRAELATTLNTRCTTPSLHSGCSVQNLANWPYLALSGPRHNNYERIQHQEFLYRKWRQRGYCRQAYFIQLRGYFNVCPALQLGHSGVGGSVVCGGCWNRVVPSHSQPFHLTLNCSNFPFQNMRVVRTSKTSYSSCSSTLIGGRSS
jgi:hypothetical protein